MSGHVVVPELPAHPMVLGGIREEMAQLGIGHVTVQLEIEDHCVEHPTVPHAADHGLGHGHRH